MTALAGLSADETAAALEAITAAIHRHQDAAEAARRAAAKPATFHRLTDLDAALWRCSCGAWRYGSRDCGTCHAGRAEAVA